MWATSDLCLVFYFCYGYRSKRSQGRRDEWRRQSGGAQRRVVLRGDHHRIKVGEFFFDFPIKVINWGCCWIFGGILLHETWFNGSLIGVGLDKVGTTQSEDIGSICHRHQQWPRGGLCGRREGGQNLGLVTAMVTADSKNETKCLKARDIFTTFKIDAWNKVSISYSSSEICWDPASSEYWDYSPQR